METSKAPKKIYIDANEDWHRTYTAFTEKAKGNDIEYTRTDAFIEKTCEWIKSMWSETDDRFNEDYTGMLIKIFKNYIERE